MALVIGNAAYKSTVPLRNTLNDADEMSRALKDVGFEVVDGRDLDKAGADRALARFAGVMPGADAALFYFAGHGLQINGQNYLLPVDARGEDELSLPFESIKLNDVISLLGHNSGVRFIVLDACRNNPFAARLAQKAGVRGFGVARGLARVEKTQGMLVAYATQPNEAADDGADANSPFTRELVRAIREPGARVGEVFQNVVARVHERTQGKQTPEVSFSLVGEFYFNRAETDLDAWKKAASSRDVQQLKSFIARFPSSWWVETARTLADAIEANGARERAQETVAKQLRLQDLKLKELQAKLDQAQESERRKEEELAAARNHQEKVLTEKEHNEKARADRERNDQKRDRLTAELEHKKRQTAAIVTEKAQLEGERARLEQALAGRLADAAVQASAPPSAKITGMDYSSNPPAAGPQAHQNRPTVRSCGEILTRIQLGEMTAADVEALKQCR